MTLSLVHVGSRRLAKPEKAKKLRIAARAMLKAADLDICHGGIVRIRLAVVIPALLAFSVAGSIAAGSAAPLAAQAHSAHVVASAASPDTLFHG
jgi:hypothetical protein